MKQSRSLSPTCQNVPVRQGRPKKRRGRTANFNSASREALHRPLDHRILVRSVAEEASGAKRRERRPSGHQTSTMPRYYCDYCDTYLTHDSVRRAMLPVASRATFLGVIRVTDSASCHAFLLAARRAETAQLRIQAQGKRCGVMHGTIICPFTIHQADQLAPHGPLKPIDPPPLCAVRNYYTNFDDPNEPQEFDGPRPGPGPMGMGMGGGGHMGGGGMMGGGHMGHMGMRGPPPGMMGGPPPGMMGGGGMMGRMPPPGMMGGPPGGMMGPGQCGGGGESVCVGGGRSMCVVCGG